MKDTLNSPARVWAVRRFRFLSRSKLDEQFYKISCHRPRENLRSIPARFDLGLERTFKIKEKQAITLEEQAFNLLNSRGRELSNSTVAFVSVVFLTRSRNMWKDFALVIVSVRRREGMSGHSPLYPDMIGAGRVGQVV
jgi:hypothetical protein